MEGFVCTGYVPQKKTWGDDKFSQKNTGTHGFIARISFVGCNMGVSLNGGTPKTPPK